MPTLAPPNFQLRVRCHHSDASTTRTFCHLHLLYTWPPHRKRCSSPARSSFSTKRRAMASSCPTTTRATSSSILSRSIIQARRLVRPWPLTRCFSFVHCIEQGHSFSPSGLISFTDFIFAFPLLLQIAKRSSKRASAVSSNTSFRAASARRRA